MKQGIFIIVGIVFIYVLVFLSIRKDVAEEKQRTNVMEEKRKTEELTRENRLKEYADSTVSLSFKGIVLGGPFYKTMQKAKKDGSIYGIKYDKTKTSATCKTKLIFFDTEKTLEVDIKVTSFQDTITSFIVTSKDYDTKGNLHDLYTAKYNWNYAITEQEEDPWENSAERLYSNSMIWKFKNQSIRYTTFGTERRENYVKNPNMRSPENRYGVRYTNYFKMITIIYKDYYYWSKAFLYENELEKEKNRQEYIRKQEKAIADSIEKEKMKIKVKNQDI